MISFQIRDAYVEYCNGPGSEKTLVLDVTYPSFNSTMQHWHMLDVPVDDNYTIGTQDDLIGKTIKLTIE